MLFNSYIFILVFLPLVCLGFHLLVRGGAQRLSVAWLVLASLVFYGYWNPVLAALVIGSVLANYGISGRLLAASSGRRRPWLVLGVVFNLGLLGFFKYTNFLTANFHLATGIDVVTDIVLPIGISFFTFQQIAYLVDAYRGVAVERDFLRYGLFVTFFPQLIAGPIVHHGEMMPQFGRQRTADLADDLSVGVTIFTIGLAKKVLIADTLALGSSPVFDQAAAGAEPGLVAAWFATLCYGFQIYFDFSGYSDMAIGLGRMFGIRLPMNFASPYKATSIIDFWRRWHITLSRFLRDYLYIPLGGGRRGEPRRYVNILVTMVLGGLWHGAGWTFLLWGAIHGILIAFNHAWSAVIGIKLPDWIGRIATFACVFLAWVPFRAADFGATAAMYRGLLGANGVGAGAANLLEAQGAIVLVLISCFGLVWFVPNSAEIMRDYRPVIPSKGYPATEVQPDRRDQRPAWQPNALSAVVFAGLFLFTLVMVSRPSEFIYFQF